MGSGVREATPRFGATAMAGNLASQAAQRNTAGQPAAIAQTADRALSNTAVVCSCRQCECLPRAAGRVGAAVMPISAENRKRYPPYWPQLSYLVRFVIDRAQCRFCGAFHGLPHPVTGSRVVLTTAHLVDMRPEADRLENLAALCQRCHNRHDIEHRRQTRRAKAAAGDLFSGGRP